jgi:hypothetical protein
MFCRHIKFCHKCTCKIWLWCNCFQLLVCQKVHFI